MNANSQPIHDALPASPPRGRWGLRLFIFLVLLTAVRLAVVLWAPLDLTGDEAEYWDWSRHPDWCYFNKGPIVAWCIWLGRLAFGDTALGIRAPAILLTALAAAPVYLLGRRLYGERVGFWSAGLMQATPLFTANGIGMTIDPPFLLCWAAALLFFHEAAASNRASAWLGLAVAVGLGLMTKYIMAFFYPCALGYLLLSREHRRRLADWRPWAAVAISLLFLAPILAWDSQHGWVNLRHNVGLTRVGAGAVVRAGAFAEFLGGQFAVMTPVLVPMMIWALVAQRKADRFCFWFSIPILGFFLLKSVQGEVYANWPLVGYVTGFFAFAHRFIETYPQPNIHVRRLTRAAVIVPAAATGVILGGLFLVAPLAPLLDRAGLPNRWNPYRYATGWAALGGEVKRLCDERGPGTFIICEQRLLTSRTAFYTPGQPRAYQKRLSERPTSQHHLWSGYEGFVGSDAIYVADERRDGAPPRIEEAFRRQFASLEERRFDARDARGVLIRTWYLYVCRDYRGAAPAPSPDSAPAVP